MVCLFTYDDELLITFKRFGIPLSTPFRKLSSSYTHRRKKNIM
uniref:Uncharacterized protein n=1 Tax=Lepeophtheirus salmonis TaxID=72036 RepID=A0A0K2TVX8_LEPSM